jgi:energy-coupling factor transport system substrate-specific component
VSWSVAAFLVLFLALSAGFGWYERTRPPAKLVALVAALAALAAAGRVAFAPIPNVKPTTDIVILAGFALGAAPGFTVGAVAALASNVIFGQGPWTPWQMVAWGLCGVVGALLGYVSRREMGRWPLAFACGLCGLGFGAMMDLSTWVTYTGEHSLSQYVAISVTSLPFNIAHAVGNVIFCALFGPAFLRALLRYRERFTVRWQPLAAAGAVIVAVVLVAGSVAGVGASSAQAASSSAATKQAASKAKRYLLGSQNHDGGFSMARGHASNPVATAWTAMALGAAGVKASKTRRGSGDVTLSRKLAKDNRSVSSAGDLERQILASHAARVSTTSMLKKLLKLQRANGSFGNLVNLTSYGILALRAGGLSARSAQVKSAAKWLAGQASVIGPRWAFGFAGKQATPTVDDTAAADMAIFASNPLPPQASPFHKAGTYLGTVLNKDGGWGQGAGFASNAQSTAFAVLTILTLARSTRVVPDPEHPWLVKVSTTSPLAYLRERQNGDGSVRYSATAAKTPVWVTAQTLLAFERAPLPVAPPH